VASRITPMPSEVVVELMRGVEEGVVFMGVGAVLVVPAGGLEARRATAGHTMTGAIADLLLG
jgi:hypothetical protein